jgi:hypothetical protein
MKDPTLSVGFTDPHTDRAVGLALMAVSAWLLWRAEKRGAPRPFLAKFLPSP